jgi:hypothetical protein
MVNGAALRGDAASENCWLLAAVKLRAMSYVSLYSSVASTSKASPVMVSAPSAASRLM